MICPNCKKESGSIKAVITRGKIINGCNTCMSSLVRGNELAAENHRQHQRREYARDIVQGFEKDYVKAYGIDAARARGWSDEDIRRYS